MKPCPALHCTRQMDPNSVVCEGCWRQVPSALRKAVRDAARQYRNADLPNARELAAAALAHAVAVARAAVPTPADRPVVFKLQMPTSPGALATAHPQPGSPLFTLVVDRRIRRLVGRDSSAFVFGLVTDDGRRLEILKRAPAQAW